MTELGVMGLILRELVRITTGTYPSMGESLETTLMRLKAEPVCLQSSEDYWTRKLS